MSRTSSEAADASARNERAAVRTGLVATVGLALVVGCATAGGGFASARRLPSEPARPDGVALDRSNSLAPPRGRADASEGVVTLRTPLGVDAARRTLREFFEAVVAEDVGRLGALASPTAVVSDLRSGAADRAQNFGFSWRLRFGKHDFLGLAPASLYRESELESFDARDPGSLPLELRGANSGEAPEPEDVILRATILSQGTKGERLFGDTLTFWLRRVEERYVVSRVAEEVPE
ncbi:MAG: hypothetical protein FJ095_03015 [Deltaproteobacteria bacterium]|nr:hypothetical protein [Deltaproteobacteria bacterium]